MTEPQKKPGRKLIAASPDLDEKETEAIAAVKAYETVANNVALFEGEHAETFKAYGEMLEKLEKKRKVADSLMRALDASFGSWERFSEQKNYNVPALYGLLGRKKFLALGGTVSRMPVYELDRVLLETAIAGDKIPKKVVAAVLTVTPKYRAPKPRCLA